MIRRGILFAIKVGFLLALIPLVLVPLYAFVHPVSTVMIGRWVTGKPVVREWKPLDQISPNLVRAVIAAEDARYCSHRGVDWVEVGHAVDGADEISELRGASTIPMQTAKNLFLWPGRQFLRKALEIPLAYYMSFMWTKRRLIEVYLNVAEWGPNGEFGAEAAAKHAFGKSANALLANEGALLAAVLPNPKQRDAARPTGGLQRTAGRYRGSADVPGSSITACLAGH
jgi:monofunctional biosynthetic peptidoglycan transglycosylase